jgi:tRNA-uridine 2-sulfurtransferase
VQRYDTPSGPEFHRANDVRKDQTYFLWGTPRDALEKVLFPVGHLEKPAVRELARGYGLITAEKAESQDICFVPGTIKEFLGERLQASKGEIVDLEGRIVGQHEGAQFYTLGQKKGLGLFQSHLERFVVAVNVAKNQIVVGSKTDCESSTLEARGVNYITDLENLPERVMAMVRYRTAPAAAKLLRADATSFTLEFDDPQFAISPGQSVVIYDGQRLLGGGFIREQLPALKAG